MSLALFSAETLSCSLYVEAGRIVFVKLSDAMSTVRVKNKKRVLIVSLRHIYVC